MVFLKSCFLDVHAAASLKKHLRNSKIITSANVTFASRLKRHAKGIRGQVHCPFFSSVFKEFI
jgi:hypothetical protein